MSTKSIGESGLAYLWTKIKAWVSGQGYLTQHQDISGKADKSTTTTAGTYKSVTVNSSGIVTGGTNPTTLSGYGITDAKIVNGTITLGSNTITPLANGNPIYFVKGTQTAKTGAWTGVIDAPALTDGMTIAYYLPYAGDGNATLNLTLSGGGTTGAVNCYYSGTSRLTTHYGAGSTIIMTYYSAGSISISGTATTDNRWSRCEYDSTITYRLTDYYGYYKAYTTLYDYQICLTKDEQYVLPINTVNASTATTKTLTTESFNPFAPIYYYSSTTDIAAGGNIGANVLAYQYLADLRYSFNTGSTLTARKAVYLVATLGSGCSATLAPNPISQTLPTTEDGYIYIYLGQTYDNYRIELSVRHPVYRYINGALRTISADSATVNGLTVQTAVPANAVFTDTTYESKAAASGGTDVSLVTTGEKATWNGKQNALTFDGTYNASSNKAATVSTVTNAINALDGGTIGTGGAGKTITSLSQTNGNVSATFADISITKSQISDFPTSMTPASHTHGNISNTGTLTDTAAAATGNDYVVIRDADNAKIQTSTIKGTDVADAVSKKHSHSTLTLSTTAQAYDGSHTLALPSTDPYTSARTPSAHNQASSTINAMTGYSKSSSAEAVTATDTLNAAISKLENQIDTKTSNVGTITGVTGSNGLTGSGTSGTVTISHAAPATSPAKTTQAVYPIKIDQYGHITAAGSAVTIPTQVTESTVSGWGFTKNTGTITGVSVNGTSVATSGVANITSVPASILSGAIPSAVTATTQSQGDNSTKLATTAYVDTAITNLPEPMIFKGSLGTGGTITTLPAASSSNEGYTYKVITAGTYASQAAKIGDTFISDGSAWILIPSGDEPSGTVTSVTIKATSPIAIDSSSAITTSGTRTLSHANSGVSAGTYKSVTVNATGHVTAGTNPTTLSGYGITDAKIADGTITLGSNTITPLTSFTETDPVFSASAAAGISSTDITNWNNKTSNTGTVTSVTIKATSPIAVDSTSAITGSGTRTLSHANSGVSAGTYRSVTVNATGHVTAGTNPTTLSGYGITDAKIASGTITLGSNSITPLTSYTETDPVFSASAASGITSSDITNWNNKTSNVGTITGIKMNGVSKGTSGVVDLGTVITAHQDISGKANLASPAFTGTPTAPTAAAGTSTTQIATTAFVQNELSDQFDEITGIIEDNEEVVASALNDLNSRIENMVVEETDPTVPDWAKSPYPPTYQYYDVGALSAYSYVDGVGFSGGTTINHFATCSTSASTTAKTASKASFQLSTGAEIIVKFTYTNTASNPTLNINNTGARSIYYNGTNIPTSALAANRVYKFVYDGSYWQLVGTLGYTKTSELTNDAGFLTSNDVVDEVNQEDKLVTSNAVYEYITEDEKVIASALNDLNERIGDNEIVTAAALNDLNSNKQNKLVSGTNIKTINNQSLLGEGNITISGGGSGGDVNVIETVKVNGTALTPDSNKAVNISAVTSFNGSTGAVTYSAPVTSVNGNTGAVVLNIPAAVTESTVSGWGFTKNAGTITGVTGSNGLTGSGTSGSVTISHAAPSTSPAKTTSAVYPIKIDQYGHITAAGTAVTIPTQVTESTVSGWGFTKNAGTITGINMNGASKGTSGVVDLGTVITAHQDISGKADSATTLAGYGITDAYTKTESDGRYYALQGGTALTGTSSSHYDLNTLTTPGNYYCASNTTAGYIDNKPSNDTISIGFRIWVSIPRGTDTSSIRQRFQFYNLVGIYERIKVSSSWGSWYLVQDDLTYKPNIYTGSSAPSSSTGSNGDIYIQTS